MNAWEFLGLTLPWLVVVALLLVALVVLWVIVGVIWIVVRSFISGARGDDSGEVTVSNGHDNT